MNTNPKKGIATAVVASAVIVVVVLVFAGYEVATVSGHTTTSVAIETTVTPTTITSTTIIPTTITTTATSISTTTATSTATSTTTATSVSTLTSTSVTTKTTTSLTTSTSTITGYVPAPLISYSADSYSTEMTALLTAFSASTGIPFAPVVSGGSTADAATIEAGAPDDLFLSASLAATAPKDLGSLSSNWAIGLGSDQMVLVYSNATLTNSAATTLISEGQSAASSNTTAAWNTFFTGLTTGSLKIGISQPSADPGGLRGWLVLELAGLLYANGNEQAYAGPLLKSGNNVTASSAANLIAPLESGQIQFLFDYRSAAIGAGLGYLSLNSHINLSNPALNYLYSKVSYTDSAGTTAGSAIEIVLTVPLSSVNTVEAMDFVEYAVSHASSLASYGLVVSSPCLLYNSVTAPQTLPATVQLLLTQGLLVTEGPI